MNKIKRRWNAEADEKQQEDIWNDVIDIVFDMGGDIDDLREAEWRAKWSDDVDDILDDHLGIVLVSGPKYFFTIYPHVENLFVSKNYVKCILPVRNITRTRSNWLRV